MSRPLAEGNQKSDVSKVAEGLFSRRPALTAFVFYAGGILLGSIVPEMPYYFLAAAIFLSIAALALHLKQISRAASRILLLTVSVVGIAQYQMAVTGFPPTHIGRLAKYGGNFDVTGEIVEEPDIRTGKTYLTVEVDSVVWRGRAFASSGRMLLKIGEGTSKFGYGERIRFSGSLFAPGQNRVPGGFNYAGYLSSREIFAMMVLPEPSRVKVFDKSDGQGLRVDRYFINKFVVPIREYLLDGYYRYLSPKRAALLGGFVLGERKDIPEEVAQLFSDTGTLHLMAVSGSNVAIVAGFCLWLMKRISRGLRIMITILVLVIFSFLTRNEPSVMRATIMAIIGLLGFSQSRNPDYLGLLGFAGLILLIIKPLWLFNIGFQLSMLASAGIIYGVPIYQRLFSRPKNFLTKVMLGMGVIFAVTLAAQLAVLPLMAYYFDRLPMMGLLANLPMATIAALLTIGGLMFLPFLFLGDLAAKIAAIPLEILLSFIEPLLAFFRNLPGGLMKISPPSVPIVMIYFCSAYLLSQSIFYKRFSFKSAIVGLSALALAIWSSNLYGGRQLSMTFVDCGDDRAVLFSSADGRNYLWYDCHEYENCRQLDLSLLPYLRHMGINRIDTLFTGQEELAAKIASEVNVKGVIHRETVVENYRLNGGESPSELILNDLVNIGLFHSDNNSGSLESAACYKVKLQPAGSVGMLAGDISPENAADIISSSRIIELPWSVQPYGRVAKKLTEVRPDILIFSPDRFRTAMTRKREQLTYLENITWSTSMAGTFRLRFDSDRLFVDYMIEP